VRFILCFLTSLYTLASIIFSRYWFQAFVQLLPKCVIISLTIWPKNSQLGISSHCYSKGVVLGLTFILQPLKLLLFPLGVSKSIVSEKPWLRIVIRDDSWLVSLCSWESCFSL
jgi:hypothetical protein